MLPLLPVRDATSDKGAITGGGVGVASVAHGLFLTDLAAAITRGGWIDKGSSIATRTTPSVRVGRGRLRRSSIAFNRHCGQCSRN